MNRKFGLVDLRNSFWGKVILFSVIMFFISLGDAILSDSLAYIIGPILAGGVAQFVGERMTFSMMGGLMALVAMILLLVTPRKLKLPQTEIQTWQ